MGELQCTLEFSLELQKFINIDLFQRGNYQIRTSFKVSPKLPAKVEVSLPKNSACSLVFPACIVNGVAVSKTFQILYKNEEVILDDLIIFKVHVLVEGHKVHEALSKADFQVNVELWFTDQNFGPDQHSSIQCVSSRVLLLHFDPSRGLHHHLPLLFDYFHLCAVTITIHASILALCQPYLRKGVIQTPTQSSIQKSSKQAFLTSSPRLSKKSHSSLETVLFGPQMGRSNVPSARMYRARLVHWEICSLLLSAYNSLCRKLAEYMTLLPPWQQLKLDFLESSGHLDNLSDFAKECHKHLKTVPLLPASKEQLFGTYENMDIEEDILVKANSDIAQMCGALILIWQQFLEIVVNREKIRQHLSKQRHFQRVKRLSEAFFIIERTRDSALAPCDSSVDAYQDVSENLRHSSYLNLLPPLEVECVDLDGDFSTLPIVYEEHFQETARRGSSNSHSSQSESTVSLGDVNFLVDDSIDENQIRRSSQGSLGQKSRSPDISATPTSPSAFSWCPDSIISTPASIKPSPLSAKKHNFKSKLLNNFKVEFESDCEEYGLSPSTFTRLNHKIAMTSKVKLRSKTVNFLRQLKKPHFGPGPNSVVLLGVRKFDCNRSIPSKVAKVSKVPFVVENGIRHSQSTLSVMSTLYTERKSLSNSESMPDLTSGMIPPPPPPPKSRHVNSDLDWAALDLSIQNPKMASSASYITSDRRGSFGKSSRTASTSPTLRSRRIRTRIPSKSVTDSGCRTPLIQSESQEERTSLSADESECKSLKYRAKYIGSSKDDSVFMSLSKMKLESCPNTDKIVSSQPVKSNETAIFNSNSKQKVRENVAAPISIDTEIKPESNICEICPPSPPVQFRDPPKTNEKAATKSEVGSKSKKTIKSRKPSNTSWSNDSCLTSLICQGTMFFPKPPAQFASDDIEESSTSNTVESNKSSSDQNSDKCEPESASEKSSQRRDHNASSAIATVESKNVDRSVDFMKTKCTILEMLTDDSNMDESYLPAQCTNNSSSESEQRRSYSLVTSNTPEEETPSIRRASVIGTEMISFVKAKEDFRKQLKYPWLWYSDFPSLASTVPYFQCDSDLRAFSPEGMHLVVCVHGLDGNSADLRLVRTYLELGLPTVNFEFLMSERNQGETFDDFNSLTDRLVSEITYYIEVYGLKPAKISFIGHSLGNIIIRSALTKNEMKPYLNRLHTFLSLSGPHLGTLYNNSGLVNMGMWFMQKWKRSGSLLQLAMKDTSDLRQTFLYKLSKSSGLEHFKNILLFGSSQDRYVPLHSARIEMCKPALKDSSYQGAVYREMVTNLIQPIIDKPDIALLRYDVHHALPSSANSLIGRAAHIAVLDSELFIEKFLAVCGLRFFV